MGQHVSSYQRKISMDNASYISGFVDGEGSFLVSFQQRAKMSTGIEARPSFTISQHRRNKEILFQICEYFGCGGIRFNKSDQTYKYEVRSLKELCQIIIPHFEKNSLKTSKASDFEKFKIICGLMKSNKHLSTGGIKEIIELAYSMNNFGARRYDKALLLKIIDKMKV